MDYSVLLGIEYNNPNETESSVGNLRRFTRHRAYSVLDKDKKLYHISIIDFLQPFNRGKKMENWAKSTFYFKDSKRLSAVEPVWYQERFFQFMKRRVVNVCATQRVPKQVVNMFKQISNIGKRKIAEAKAKEQQRKESEETINDEFRTESLLSQTRTEDQ